MMTREEQAQALTELRSTLLKNPDVQDKFSQAFPKLSSQLMDANFEREVTGEDYTMISCEGPITPPTFCDDE